MIRRKPERWHNRKNAESFLLISTELGWRSSPSVCVMLKKKLLTEISMNSLGFFSWDNTYASHCITTDEVQSLGSGAVNSRETGTSQHQTAAPERGFTEQNSHNLKRLHDLFLFPGFWHCHSGDTKVQLKSSLNKYVLLSMSGCNYSWSHIPKGTLMNVPEGMWEKSFSPVFMRGNYDGVSVKNLALNLFFLSTLNIFLTQ